MKPIKNSHLLFINRKFSRNNTRIGYVLINTKFPQIKRCCHCYLKLINFLLFKNQIFILYITEKINQPSFCIAINGIVNSNNIVRIYIERKILCRIYISIHAFQKFSVFKCTKYIEGYCVRIWLKINFEVFYLNRVFSQIFNRKFERHHVTHSKQIKSWTIYLQIWFVNQGKFFLCFFKRTLCGLRCFPAFISNNSTPNHNKKTNKYSNSGYNIIFCPFICSGVNCDIMWIAIWTLMLLCFG